ncbi:hypothetical protein NQ318_014365 [Aromia moschata]|uniref:Uncharacterized protein n=1 Tax=Aromia moschata TaxID=1265417 RepID=A0AAV8Z0U9_9CUCU|nr:hypothetical protein NQ318_014365 [Aromia moschata]
MTLIPPMEVMALITCEYIIKHLPKSSEILCSIVDRDRVYKERAYLFIKNYSDKWYGTNLSAGREFCCKDNMPYKSPPITMGIEV